MFCSRTPKRCPGVVSVWSRGPYRGQSACKRAPSVIRRGSATNSGQTCTQPSVSATARMSSKKRADDRCRRTRAGGQFSRGHSGRTSTCAADRRRQAAGGHRPGANASPDPVSQEGRGWRRLHPAARAPGGGRGEDLRARPRRTSTPLRLARARALVSPRRRCDHRAG
jgi:hypothetical protein